jgi:hypothetical protein
MNYLLNPMNYKKKSRGDHKIYFSISINTGGRGTKSYSKKVFFMRAHVE